MVVAPKRDDLIYHWLSKVDSRNVSLLPKSAFTRRKNSLNMKQIDDPCSTRNKEKECGNGTELVAKIKNAPHINRDGSFPISGHQHLMAEMNGNREAQDPIPGIQSWNYTPGRHSMLDACARVPDDSETREKSGSRVITSQSPCDVSHPHATIANHDSRDSNPLLSNDIPRGVYDRHPRHKTRPDRYELKDIGPSMMPSDSRARAQKPLAAKKRRTNNVVENLPKDTSNPSFPSASAGAIEKQGVRKGKKRKENILENSFKAPNVTQDRLSLPVNHGVGFLSRARAGRGGVPDLSFSGMGFLSNDVKRPNEPEPTQHNHSKRVREENDTDGGISRYFSKQPAGPSMPNRYSSEKDVPRVLSRQPNNILLNPEAGANCPTGTEPSVPELATRVFIPNAAASSFREASVNPSDSASNPLWRQANRQTPWLPQVRSRMLGARHAMLMAAKTARNIAMLDQCRKAVQHAARMVSHVDRGRIDTEVERDYPIPELASGFSFRQTNREIGDMIRGENRFLAEICTVFEPEYNDFSARSEEGNAAKGTASINGTPNSAPNPHHSGPSATHTASNNIQNRPSPTGINGSPKAAQNTASNSDPSQKSAARTVAHATSNQPSPDECNGNSGGTQALVLQPTPNNRHLAQTQSSDNGTLGSGQLSAPILDSNNEPTPQTMANSIQYQLDQSMGNSIPVIGQSVSNELTNVHPFDNHNTESNKVRHIEQNKGEMQPSLLWNTPKPDRPLQREIEASTKYIFHDLQDEGEASSVISGAQDLNPIRAERIQNHLFPQQSCAAQSLYFNGPNVPANPLTTNASGYSHNISWHVEQISNSPHLSSNYSPYTNGGNRSATPASSIRSGFSHNQNLNIGWICESYPASFIEQQHLQFGPSSSIQHGHQNHNLPHVTASSPTLGSVPTAPRSGYTMPTNTPWYNNQTTPWATSNAPHYAQPIPNSHPNFAHRDSSSKSNKFVSTPTSSFPFSQPNKLH
ncbi:hypothetical protein EMCG_07256 [[Emmonsia] crescens]|uniref:Uncharacterized protein n=1 Tax=[Emmonsia] crescens TaxID=73230 RepID=A0A0G2IA09_9EURO|nr:hypothetical protein EMCG_07256 [Emmonsia crescens UAMH 3008]